MDKFLILSHKLHTFIIGCEDTRKSFSLNSILKKTASKKQTEHKLLPYKKTTAFRFCTVIRVWITLATDEGVAVARVVIRIVFAPFGIYLAP